jgi:hypothetical protein
VGQRKQPVVVGAGMTVKLPAGTVPSYRRPALSAVHPSRIGPSTSAEKRPVWGLDVVAWANRAAPRLRAVLEPTLSLTRRALATTASVAGQLELTVERLVMDPGPPSPWHGRRP